MPKVRAGATQTASGLLRAAGGGRRLLCFRNEPCSYGGCRVHSDAGHPWDEAVYRREGSGGWRLYDYDCVCGMSSGESARTAQDNAQQAFLRRGRISHWCAALCGTCRFAIGCPAAGRRSLPMASLLSTPRCLATLSTGAFSCRRSRCLGRRLLPPSAVLVGRGSWARGVPRG